MLQLLGDHILQPTAAGTGEGSPPDSRTSYSGWTSWSSFWSYKTRQALYLLETTWECVGVYPSSLHVFCEYGAHCYRLFHPCPITVRVWIIAGKKSYSFPVGTGRCQDCPLSPILFITFMDKMYRCNQGFLIWWSQDHVPTSCGRCGPVGFIEWCVGAVCSWAWKGVGGVPLWMGMSFCLMWKSKYIKVMFKFLLSWPWAVGYAWKNKTRDKW